jgi:hypothetical protein
MAICIEKPVADGEESKYANAEDFLRIFSDDRDALYRLSFLLTQPDPARGTPRPRLE